MSNRKIDIAVFVTIFIFLFIVSVLFLTTPDFDFFNYQAYNCYSLLNNRFSQDFFAANTRTCINPILYLPEYLLMFKLNNHPYIFILISLLDSVFLLFLVYKLTILSFKDKLNNCILGITVLFSVIYVACSPVMMNILDFSRGDGKIAVLCLLGLYLVLKNVFLPDSSKRNLQILLAGILLGIAFVLKSTAIVYVAGILAIVGIYGFSKKIQKPFKVFFLLASTVFICFVLLNGFWMYICYQQYHNPIFPYYNDIFKSEYADYINFVNTDYARIMPDGWLQFVFYPFFKVTQQNWEFFNHFFGIEDFVWDPRYAINYIIVTLISIYSVLVLFAKKTNKLFECTNKNVCIGIILFTVFSYIINLFLFKTYRYIAASSALYGIILAMFVINVLNIIKRNNYKNILICSYIVCIAFVYTTFVNGELPIRYVNFIDGQFKMKQVSKIIEFQNYNYDDNSDVFLFGFVVSVFAVNQNKNVSYIGVPNDIAQAIAFEEDMEYSKYLENKIIQELKSNKKIYIIFSENPVNTEEIRNYMDAWKNKFNRKLVNCERINFEIFNTELPFDYHKCELQSEK